MVYTDYDYDTYCEVMDDALNTMDKLLDDLSNKNKDNYEEDKDK